MTTVSGWCSAPAGARPQHERCRMSPSCECSCHHNGSVDRDSALSARASHTPTRPDGPILPHGTQPTERQWQIAEALDDLVMSQGVVLDDGTLDWLVDWVDHLVARRLAEHRADWASYIEHWGGSVGPEPPTPERIVAALRLPESPFGVEASA